MNATVTPQHKAVRPDSRRGSGGHGKKRPKGMDFARHHNLPRIAKDTKKYISPTSKLEKMLRVIILGGAEEVGRNCTVLEYDGDIIIIDMGLQFPDEDMPGIDYIIPNLDYLKQRKKDIKGLVITHAHMDHIGAIPHVMEDLGNPIIYTGKLTQGIIEKRHYQYPNVPKLKFFTIDETVKVKLGKFDLEFFHVNHNIINCFGIFVKTPAGNVVHTGDFKFDKTPLNDKPFNYHRLEEIRQTGVDVALVDSTNAASPGEQISELTVTVELDKIYAMTKGRLVIGTFASNLNRIQQCITLAEKYGRKVILEGRSINANVEIAHELGFFEVKKGNIIETEEYVKNRAKYPDEKIVIIGTGAQGERNAFMMKYVSAEHRFLAAEAGDTTIFSSSVIPGNERTVSSLKDALSKKGCNIIHYQMMDVHAGGHAKQDDLKLFMNLIKPVYYVPIESNHHVLRTHADLAIANGFDTTKVFITENGRVMEFDKKDGKVYGVLTQDYIPSDYVFVDGLGVGDISHVVLRDRLIMAQDGMLVIIATIDHKTGRLIGNPDIISRGFIYMKENKKLIEDTRMRVKQICMDVDTKSPAFDDHIKNKVRDDLGEFLYMKTKRRPMILPVVIKV